MKPTQPTMCRATEITLKELGAKIHDFSYVPYHYVRMGKGFGLEFLLPKEAKWLGTRFSDSGGKCEFCGHNIVNQIPIFSQKHGVALIIGTDCALKIFGVNKELDGLYKEQLAQLESALRDFYHELPNHGDFRAYIREKFSKKSLKGMAPTEYELSCTNVCKKAGINWRLEVKEIPDTEYLTKHWIDPDALVEFLRMHRDIIHNAVGGLNAVETEMRRIGAKSSKTS